MAGRLRRASDGSKLTPDRAARIIQAVKAGNFLNVAAKFANIGERTLSRWLSKGRDHQDTGRTTIYSTFLRDVDAAECAAEVFAVAQIRQAAAENWTAAAWYLERKYPDRWGRKDRTLLEGGAAADAKPIVVRFGGRYLPNGGVEEPTEKAS